MAKRLDTKNIREWATDLKCGEEILLSGVVYTARDAAHKKIAALIDNGKPLPFPLKGSVIYYAGPSPAKEGRVCGSFGPTTSGRMDGYPQLFDNGLAAAVGKGDRNKTIIDALIRNKSIYFIAIGGAGAIAAKHIIDCKEIAFSELGCESVKRLVFEDFPLIVAIDSDGKDIYTKGTVEV
ncbi:MAG TPA: TRZ/ATZ family protein [Clostridiales bacterium]|nr:TRZ/ATZ family protein [Clostridiales bacterium]